MVLGRIGRGVISSLSSSSDCHILSRTTATAQRRSFVTLWQASSGPRWLSSPHSSSTSPEEKQDFEQGSTPNDVPPSLSSSIPHSKSSSLSHSVSLHSGTNLSSPSSPAARARAFSSSPRSWLSQRALTTRDEGLEERVKGANDTEEGSKGEQVLQTHSSIIPGVALSTAVFCCSSYVATALGPLLLQAQGLDGAISTSGPSPVSPIPIAILLGLGVGNSLPVEMKEKLRPGLQFAGKTLLRAGIVCVGIKLSALDVYSLGVTGKNDRSIILRR